MMSDFRCLVSGLWRRTPHMGTNDYGYLYVAMLAFGYVHIL